MHSSEFTDLSAGAQKLKIAAHAANYIAFLKQAARLFSEIFPAADKIGGYDKLEIALCIARNRI